MRPFSIERLHDLLTSAPAGTFFRHDVDFSPAAAVSMARFEQERGVRSTFYVMTTSPFYTAAEGLELAAEVSRLGHRVGVHLDWRVSQLPRWGLFSFHCPRAKELWRDDIQPARNAYAAIWQGRYFSDSRGRFAYGDPEDAFGGEPLQIGLHPEWWFDPFWTDAIDPEPYRAFFHEPHPITVAA